MILKHLNIVYNTLMENRFFFSLNERHWIYFLFFLKQQNGSEFCLLTWNIFVYKGITNTSETSLGACPKCGQCDTNKWLVLSNVAHHHLKRVTGVKRIEIRSSSIWTSWSPSLNRGTRSSAAWIRTGWGAKIKKIHAAFTFIGLHCFKVWMTFWFPD